MPKLHGSVPLKFNERAIGRAYIVGQDDNGLVIDLTIDRSEIMEAVSEAVKDRDALSFCFVTEPVRMSVPNPAPPSVECGNCPREMVYCPWCGHKLTVDAVGRAPYNPDPYAYHGYGELWPSTKVLVKDSGKNCPNRIGPSVWSESRKIWLIRVLTITSRRHSTT